MSGLQSGDAPAAEGGAETLQIGEGVRNVNTELPLLRNPKRKASTPVRGCFSLSTFHFRLCFSCLQQNALNVMYMCLIYSLAVFLLCFIR